jgi:hypothetical protein
MFKAVIDTNVIINFRPSKRKGHFRPGPLLGFAEKTRVAFRRRRDKRRRPNKDYEMM